MNAFFSLTTIVAGVGLVAGAASAQCGEYETARDDSQGRVVNVDHHKSMGKDIVETALSAGSFDTLATALKAAGLVETLKGDGPFTVFAPTDAAFAKLPSATLKTLLRPENKDQLASILTYHVVPGKVMAKDVVNLETATTVNGQRIDIEVRDGTVYVDGAKVTSTDVKASNGVIHVIDSVILPESSNIVETAQSAGTFNTLLTAAKAAGLAEYLSEEGPITVFAPTDAAFAKLPEGTVESLLKPENKEKLASILKYHVVKGRVFADQALKAGKASTLEGSSIRVRSSYGDVKVNDAKVVSADIEASNGVVHVVDTVLLP